MFHSKIKRDITSFIRGFFFTQILGSFANLNLVDILLKMDIPITGANFEVCPGQMEIQICSEGINQGDNLMMARYILHLISEKYNKFPIARMIFS